MQPLQFFTTSVIHELGIQIVTLLIRQVHNTAYNTQFEVHKQKVLNEVQDMWDMKEYTQDPVLKGFRDLHIKVGRSNRDYVASPEALLKRFLKTGTLPHINLLVDIYNLESLASRLALGAHDTKYIHGNVTLRLTDGSEHFRSLGTNQNTSIFPKEYAYIDDAQDVICRLEVLQCDATKVTTDTRDIFCIVQGNSNTSPDYVTTHAHRLGNNITKYCGGEYDILPTHMSK